MMKSIANHLAVALMVGGLALVPATATEPAVQAKALEQMSKQADTPEEHAAAAKQFRLRAESFEAQAEKHEKNAKEMRNRGPANPMATKWPAMAQSGWQRESQLAIQARRAAQECYARASKHVNLAVEGQLAKTSGAGTVSASSSID